MIHQKSTGTDKTSSYQTTNQSENLNRTLTSMEAGSNQTLRNTTSIQLSTSEPSIPTNLTLSAINHSDISAAIFTTKLSSSTKTGILLTLTTEVRLSSQKYVTSSRTSAFQTSPLLNKSSPFVLVTTQSQHHIRTTNNYNNLGSVSSQMTQYSTTRRIHEKGPWSFGKFHRLRRHRGVWN